MFKKSSNASLVEVSIKYKDKSRIYAFTSAKWRWMVFVFVVLFFSIITAVSVTTPFLSKIGVVGGIVPSHKFVNNVMGTTDNDRQSALWQYYTNNGRDTVITRENLIKAINSFDSLDAEVMLWRVYNENITQILAGKSSSITSDSVLMSFINPSEGKTELVSKLDTLLRERVIGEIDKKNQLNRRGEFQNMFRPVIGKIIKPFNRKTNKSITIAVAGQEPVYAISGGTVLLTTWSPYYGYMGQIQHGAGIVSLYSNMSQLMVKDGDIVAAGAIIGYVGVGENVKKDTTITATAGGDDKFLRFSMWHEGNAVDPEMYILF